MFEDRIIQIRREFERLRAADSQFKVFGSESHQYKLQPPVSEDFLADQEQISRIRLPEDYREFLLQFSSGGAGPHYGLGVFSSLSRETSLPFPYCDAWNDEAVIPGGPPEYKKWEGRYFSQNHVAGTMNLGHEGCGHITFLVVTGAERGHVWGDSRVSDGGLYPLSIYDGPLEKQWPLLTPLFDSRSDKRISFLDWYQAWITMNLIRLGAT